MKNALYIISLLFLIISVFLIVQYPDSGRMYVIAGACTPIGIVINILSFSMKKKQL
ncbi:hypothetical protein [Ancylomarina sp. 16SWW S1-10-2]|uniref:hypothetical protein n=1 Tax=Ancylomarina sp. 16SWW S1-10-2 TaxID=2499681 RepID=UPI0012ADC398|nr:hypothetical protein [Ancylomarina sp. 16SWW S1-10-2]